ncbi:Src-domain containing protein [Metarhizium album ARSEF 1941]|uniref:Src-domain containing protein n=1 Tax=Metarhizium album (strain ARSEF 1941) TaxID=1081103 RepID=A0A0B2X7P1_METAS|nr:Src-domain containing protein [Metarhizium album ARSEF 1941]KHO01535.1 Src-domain containing protein [Metarhizium album ARSEF 1941]
MVPAPQALPAKFPCWCRAVYSWGGESKRDLGFIEGDLIECLNAGDGSWWVGRLYRDRRTIGSFPSNFVEILPEEFRPMTRSASPLPGSNTPSPKNLPAKSKTFRKPFEAYAKAPHYTTAKQPTSYRNPPKTASSAAAAPAPEAQQQQLKDKSASSLNRSVHDTIDRVPSPPAVRRYGSRAPSPALSQSYRDGHRGTSARDSAPPAPPPHRHVGGGSRPGDMSRHGSNASFRPYSPAVMTRHGSNASYHHPPQTPTHASHVPEHNSVRQGEVSEEHTPQGPSPCQHSSDELHMTPSPLREAMDSVMKQLDQLDGLGNSWGGDQVRHAEVEEQPLGPWAPESFDAIANKSRRKGSGNTRPLTSMGIAHRDEGYETWSGGSSQDTSLQNGTRGQKHELPELSNYVERMEKRFQSMHHYSKSAGVAADIDLDAEGDMPPPPPPPKGQPYQRPRSSAGEPAGRPRQLRPQQSAYEIGRGSGTANGSVGRTMTTRTNTTNASTGNQSHTSSSTQSSGRTLWSGVSAGGISSTSAGSMARQHMRSQSAMDTREAELDRPDSPFTGVTYHSSHASQVAGNSRSEAQTGVEDDLTACIGGLVQPKAPKRSIFKKIFDSAKTGVASNRGSIAAGSIGGGNSVRASPFNRPRPSAAQTPMSSRMTGISGPDYGSNAARDMGLTGGSSVDWVQVRRDVNRSNSLSKAERNERQERCQVMEYPALNPVDEMYEEIEGDEAADGMPVRETINYQSINLSQVDKNSRFIGDMPPMTSAIQLATTYVCRPYRSDVQRLRAIFTWVSEKICWEEDFEGDIDTRRVIQAKRACAEEYAVLVMEMCAAVGLECEIVRGYLKNPGDVTDLNMMPRSNHWWNAVIVDNEWRIIDCCLASPSNPKRGLYSSANGATADSWWFLARPTEVCWTHVPEHHDQQHIVPPVAHEILLNLPCTCPSFFRNEIEMVDYNTAATRIEDLEMVHIKFNVPADIEVAAEVEARAYTRDADGDVFESGEVVKKRALAQAEWYDGVKRYTVKALLPGDEGQGTLKIYAGKRGLMHSIKDIPHPLAFALPIVHTGENPPYDFVTRHPTPHAQRHDIYVVQPQCQRLALNNTFVFAIRQHPSSTFSGHNSTLTPASNPGRTSPNPFARPSSAMSMNASSVSGSNPSSASGTVAGKKPAKLAIQTPGGKILRLMRKEDRKGIAVGSRGLSDDEDVSDGGTWETIIKCSERGVWRGLVLADRTARWCVFAEWTCVG